MRLDRAKATAVDPDNHIDIPGLRGTQQGLECKQAPGAVQLKPLSRPLPCLLQDSLKDRDCGDRLSDPLLGVGVTDQDRAVLVNQGHHAPVGQVGLSRDATDPGKVQIGKDHRYKPTGSIQHGVCKCENRATAGWVDLVVADGERTDLDGAPEKGTVAHIDRTANGCGAAEDLAVRPDRTQVGIPRGFFPEVEEEIVARNRIAPAHGRKLGQAGQQFPRPLDQSFLLSRGESNQRQGIGLGLSGLMASSFHGGKQQHHEGGNKRQDDVQHHPDLQTRKTGRDGLHCPLDLFGPSGAEVSECIAVPGVRKR